MFASSQIVNLTIFKTLSTHGCCQLYDGDIVVVSPLIAVALNLCVGFACGSGCSSYPFYFEIISQFHGYII